MTLLHRGSNFREVLISCEKCSTTYVLDDALIPPQGASVQCTNCGNVFIAKQDGSTTPPPSSEVAGSAEDQVADAPPPGPSKPSAMSKTTMFGTGAATGAAPKPAGRTPPRTDKTMVFGAAPTRTPPPPQPPATERVAASGATPSALPVGTNKTMVFGGTPPVRAPAASHPPATSKTMVFGGSLPTAAAQVRPDAATMVPKVEGAAAPTPPMGGSGPTTSKTMVFGGTLPTSAAARPAVAKGPATSSPQKPSTSSATKRTVVFGGAAPASGTSAAVKAVAVGTFASAARAKPAPSVESNKTIIFGGASPSAPKADPLTSKPVVFGTPEAPSQTFATPAVETPPNSQTMVFGMNGGATPAPTTLGDAVTPVPDAQDESGIGGAGMPPATTSRPRVDSQTNRTMIIGSGPAPLISPPTHVPAPARNLPPEIITPHDVSTGTVGDSGIDLPPESETVQGAFDELGAPQDNQSNRGLMVATMVVLVAIAVALCGAVVWRVVGRDRAAEEVRNKAGLALQTLRKDDLTSRSATIASMASLASENPISVSVRATAAIAYALDADDARAELARSERLAQLFALRLANDPAGPMRAERLKDAQDGETRARNAAAAATAALRSAVTEVARVSTLPNLPKAVQYEAARAQALSAAVLGDSKAVELAERARQLQNGSDIWWDIILPEYALNGGAARAEAMQQLEATIKRDNTFLRPYILAARLALMEGDGARAEEELGRLNSLLPSHEAAKQIRTWLALREAR